MSKNLSILIPTRAREKNLKKCLDALNKKVKHPNEVEILVKVDTDDQKTTDFLQSYKSKIDLIVVNSDRKGGYASLHEFYNELFKHSSGKFIFCLNDDAVVKTKNFDTLTHKFIGQDVCLHHNPAAPHNDKWYFPIIARSILEEIGHVSESVFYDGYLYFMLQDLGVFRDVDLDIDHGNLSDTVAAEKAGVLAHFRRTQWEFDTKQNELQRDRQKIIELLSRPKKSEGLI
ncbi:MAG: glycosyltransferase family 2 protein [Spirochaetota bacterium]